VKANQTRKDRFCSGEYRMMKPFKILCTTIAIASLLALSACASNRTATDATDQAPVAPKVQPTPQVSAEPRLTSTPGAFWPPKPSDEAAADQDSVPPPKMLNTDELVLEGKRNPKADLKTRAVERWALLIAGRGEEAFTYLSPGYQKTHDGVRYGQEMAGRPVRWFRAAFDHSECASETSCEVTLLVDFRVRMSAGMGATESFAFVKERWIATDGVWYHLPPDAG
jgi:hypothetical protein